MDEGRPRPLLSKSEVKSFIYLTDLFIRLVMRTTWTYGQREHHSRVEAAVERLNQDPYLLATVSAVPIIGGSITQVLTGIGQQIVQKRNAKLFEQLSEHLASVDEQSIRRDYFETPEGIDLLIKAMDESCRTRSDEKRDLIARILRGALTKEKGEYSPEETCTSSPT